MYQDILRYYFQVPKEPYGSDAFKERELQGWLIKNNDEIKNYYSGFKGKIPIKNRIASINKSTSSKSEQIKNRKNRIKRIFHNIILLGLIDKKGKAPMEKFASLESPPQTDLYSFTTSGELVALLIKSNNLQNENHPNDDQIIELSKINKKISRLFGFIFDYLENKKSSYLFDYYKKFFNLFMKRII